ncbi:hypothetical protein T08_5171 [Trichinella sp. T8]|nr:hypothetical protein T08_5171 [Trichinella sp. T8]
METDSSLSLVHQMQTTKKIAASVPHHFFPYFVIIFTLISNTVQYLERSNLSVDIPTVKGKWPYRYVSEFPLRYKWVTSKQSKMFGFAIQCATMVVEVVTYRS